MCEYFQSIPPIEIPRQRRKDQSLPCTLAEMTIFQALPGTLNCIGHVILPQAFFAASDLSPNVHHQWHIIQFDYPHLNICKVNKPKAIKHRAQCNHKSFTISYDHRHKLQTLFNDNPRQAQGKCHASRYLCANLPTNSLKQSIATENVFEPRK